MIEYIKKKKKLVIKYVSRQSARIAYENARDMTFLSMILSLFVGFFYPTLGSVFCGISVMSYLLLNKEFFADRFKREYYQRMLQPKAHPAHFIKIGYEVPPEELEKHLMVLNELDSPATRQNASKILQRKERMAKASKHNEVGLSKNQLVTHFWVIGTTGAGKTSFIMTLIDMAIKAGAGCVFVDGKADEKMFAKLYNLATRAGRAHDVYLLNFLGIEGEAKEHTNTFNPLAGAPPEQIIEFLMSLQGEASGDQAYWQGRGKALLSPIVYFLSFRERYYNEKFTITMLADFINDADKFITLCGLTMALCRFYEKKLSSDPSITSLISKASYAKGLADDKFPCLDSIVYYYTIRPSEKSEILMRGYNFDRLSDLWRTYVQVMNYSKSLHQEVMQAVDRSSLLFYKGLQKAEVDFETVSWSQSLQIYKKTIDEEAKKFLQAEENSGMSYEDIVSQVNFPAKGGDASQQHAYAQQQWTNIFSVLNTYSYIFDTLEPEVDVLDILKNQKILYVLLPPLKQSASTTQLLGRLVVTAMRFAISKALGGYVENLNAKQKQILQEIITPRPLGLVVFDEYGSYPVEGIDTFLAQVRSINISVVLSTQDYTSARVGGKDENSVKRAWANTQKLVLRVKDSETLDNLEKIIRKRSEVSDSIVETEMDGFMTQATASFGTPQDRSSVDFLTGFKNGIGMLLTEEEPVITQIYWADAPPADEVYLNHYVKFS